MPQLYMLKFSNSRRIYNIILPAHKQLTSSRKFFINAVRLFINKLIGLYQCGFKPGKFAINQIFTLRQSLE